MLLSFESRENKHLPSSRWGKAQGGAPFIGTSPGDCEGKESPSVHCAKPPGLLCQQNEMAFEKGPYKRSVL